MRLPAPGDPGVRNVENLMSDAVKILIVTLIIWVGIFLYLLKLDREVARLKRQDRG